MNVYGNFPSHMRVVHVYTEYGVLTVQTTGPEIYVYMYVLCIYT